LWAVQLAALRHKAPQKPVAGLWNSLRLGCWEVLVALRLLCVRPLLCLALCLPLRLITRLSLCNRPLLARLLLHQ
jgi:hypothetical protein